MESTIAVGCHPKGRHTRTRGDDPPPHVGTQFGDQSPLRWTRSAMSALTALIRLLHPLIGGAFTVETLQTAAYQRMLLVRLVC